MVEALAAANYQGIAMLRQELDLKYVVYPSWAETGYAYPWRELPTVLADPLSSGRLDRYAEKLHELPEIFNPPTRLIDGPRGGGIIVIGPAAPQAFNIVLFSDVANIGQPDDMDRISEQFPTYVGWIEPFDGLGGLLTTGKRARNYPIRATAEHVDAAGEEVYWILSLRDARGQLKSLDEVPRLAECFGLRATLLGAAPAALDQSAAPWFDGWNEHQRWYRIEGVNERVGLQFSILLYIGLHLRKSVPTLRWTHLVARIEGEPKARHLATQMLRRLKS